MLDSTKKSNTYNRNKIEGARKRRGGTVPCSRCDDPEHFLHPLIYICSSISFFFQPMAMFDNVGKYFTNAREHGHGGGGKMTKNDVALCSLLLPPHLPSYRRCYHFCAFGYEDTTCFCFIFARNSVEKLQCFIGGKWGRWNGGGGGARRRKMEGGEGGGGHDTI